MNPETHPRNDGAGSQSFNVRDPKCVLLKFAYGSHHGEQGKICWSRIPCRVFAELHTVYGKNNGTRADAGSSVEIMCGLFVRHGFTLK